MTVDKMRGIEVTEEEAASGLGFANVAELRRWRTEMGRKVADMEERLRSAESDRDSFRRHGERMQLVLEKVLDEFERNLPSEYVSPKLLLAVKVVLNKGVDREHKLDGWFDGPERG